ncbi:hypothetical protein OAO87_03030 [bacterium]|nr:hypothetical protein [bacterium]
MEAMTEAGANGKAARLHVRLEAMYGWQGRAGGSPPAARGRLK